ncbi:hypothetical protein ACFWJ4_41175, partial [Kitasatospora sp. NPDC127067]|uniref:hypothetical protein n=1 Tax=Kitasatospora sp. NPDC127067 TaxID=3347126 RepID=UPI00364E92F0
MKHIGARRRLAAVVVLLGMAGTLAQTGTAQAATRAAGQCGGNVADYTYPARAFQFDGAISK